MKKQRRKFIRQASLLTATAMLSSIVKIHAMAKTAPKKILLHSAWQTVNIGDIGHTFGILELFGKYLPDYEIILWSKNALDRNVDQLLKQRFPKLVIIDHPYTLSGASDPQVQKAFKECVMMIHSSGPFVVGQPGLQDWWNQTRKPFGVYGVSLDEVKEELKTLINQASFFYCRDTESLKYLKTLNLKCPVQDFAPDATFAINIHKEKPAAEFMASSGLKEKEFICIIPRLRFTPYWKMRGGEPTPEDTRKYTISMQYKETDSTKLKDIITRWVNETGLKVLVCPEVTYQVELGQEIVDSLPPEIKKNVVWRSTFWLPDEAASVYAKSKAMVCFEPHSLIMAVAEGIPSIHLKQPSDTRKGQMWRDIGLGDWYFLIDETPSSQIADTLLKINNNYTQALQITANARTRIRQIQDKNFREIISTIGK